jgi:hypothetical protein
LSYESPIVFPYSNRVRVSKIRDGKWHQWATSAQSLILAVFGKSSPYSINFQKLYDKCDGSKPRFESLKAVFLSAKEDFEGGYVFNVELLVSGEIFGDFVNLARQSLQEGYKDVAAVLACAALEDSLKRFAKLQELDVEGKTLQTVVNALKSTGLIVGQKNHLDLMVKIRNDVMHASWDKVSELEVQTVIGFVEQFLLKYFSDS